MYGFLNLLIKGMGNENDLEFSTFTLLSFLPLAACGAPPTYPRDSRITRQIALEDVAGDVAADNKTAYFISVTSKTQLKAQSITHFT